jgi:hypothetical protein
LRLASFASAWISSEMFCLTCFSILKLAPNAFASSLTINTIELTEAFGLSVEIGNGSMYLGVLLLAGRREILQVVEAVTGQRADTRVMGRPPAPSSAAAGNAPSSG